MSEHYCRGTERVGCKLAGFSQRARFAWRLLNRCLKNGNCLRPCNEFQCDRRPRFCESVAECHVSCQPGQFAIDPSSNFAIRQDCKREAHAKKQRQHLGFANVMRNRRMICVDLIPMYENGRHRDAVGVAGLAPTESAGDGPIKIKASGGLAGVSPVHQNLRAI